MKLLRALQEGAVEPVGGRKVVKLDVRIISATNRDLIADVKAGRFREDLFYRLHVFPLSVPPLRTRREDVPDLARHFLTRFAAEEGKRVRGISREALSLLAAANWPGNVRQLENAMFRAVVLAEGEEIGINEFPQIAAQVSSDEASIPQLSEPSPAIAASWPDRPALDVVPVTDRDPRAYAADHRPPRRRPPARGHRARCDPVRHLALSGADVRSCPQAAESGALDPLSQASKARVSKTPEEYVAESVI